MANGDTAAAAGMDVVPSTSQAKKGYDEINKTRDYIADRTSAVTPVAKGGTGATDAASARTNLGVYGKTETYSKAEVDNHNWDAGDITTGTLGRPVATTGGGNFGAGLFIGGTGRGFDNLGGLSANESHHYGQTYMEHARANPVATGYVAAYIDSASRLGIVPSSRRFKKYITAWSPDVQAVFAMQLVTFRYKAAIAGTADAPLEVGLIAEELDDLGLGWLVYRDDEGLAAGIHYERVALALLPAIQNLNERVTALEDAR
jgi:hypothetical protein